MEMVQKREGGIQTRRNSLRALGCPEVPHELVYGIQDAGLTFAHPLIWFKRWGVVGRADYSSYQIRQI